MEGTLTITVDGTSPALSYKDMFLVKRGTTARITALSDARLTFVCGNQYPRFGKVVQGIATKVKLLAGFSGPAARSAALPTLTIGRLAACTSPPLRHAATCARVHFYRKKKQVKKKCFRPTPTTTCCQRCHSRIFGRSPKITFNKDFTLGGIPYHIAVIYSGHRLICWGVNNTIDHAEIVALRRFRALQERRQMKAYRCKMVVVRIRKCVDGSRYFSLSMPCMRCAAVIRTSGISRIYWSTDEGMFAQCRACEIDSMHTSRAFRGAEK